MTDFKSALLKSLLLHLGIAGVLVATAHFPATKPTVMEVTLNAPQAPEEKAVEAIAVDQSKVEKRIAELKKQEADKKAAEQKRIRELEKRAEEAKKQRQDEARRIRKLEQERKAKEREKAEAEAQAKKARKIQEQERDKANKAKLEKEKAEKAAKAAADKRKREEEAAKQAEAERKRKEEEAKRKAEEARQKALAEQLLQEQLAAEAAARSKVRQQQVLSEVDKYTALITARIQQNLLTDEKMKGKQCKLNIRLAFNGLVTSVKSLGGDKLVCDAALRAVQRAETLPVSSDKEVFEKLKNIDLTVIPTF